MSLDLDELRTFIKLAELGSFTRTGDQLGISKSKVSLQLQSLEARLGSDLVQRSTRHVRLTPEGAALLPRAQRLLTEADELESAAQASRAVRGRVRLDMPVSFARIVIVPRLPLLLARYPELELVLSATDRKVDPVREGFDCVLRVGRLTDSELVVRRLGTLRMANCASQEYLRQHGVPEHLEDLDRHWIVHYSATLGPERPSFEYPDGNGYREWPMRSLVTVNNADAYQAACIAGLGIIQAPRVGLLSALASGQCVELLQAFTCEPMPVSLIHTHGRQVPRRVRVVLDWIAEQVRSPETQLCVSPKEPRVAPTARGTTWG